MWKYGLKWTLLLEIKCDHTRQPWGALQFRPQWWEAGRRSQKKRRDPFSGTCPVCSRNPTWMFFLFHDSFFQHILSLPLTVAVLSPLESVASPLGENRMWLHELLKLTKAYSFPINLPRASAQQLWIPSMGCGQGIKKSWLCSLTLFILGPKESVALH